MKIEFFLHPPERDALDWYAAWNNQQTEKLQGVTDGNYLKMTSEDLIPIAVRHFIAQVIYPKMKEEREVFNDE